MNKDALNPGWHALEARESKQSPEGRGMPLTEANHQSASAGVSSAGIVVWENDPIAHSADEVMQYAAAKSRAERTDDPQALTETESWLREALLIKALAAPVTYSTKHDWKESQHAPSAMQNSD